MLKGGCNCGAVRFEVSAQVRDVYMCHCSICRRFTGAAAIAVIVVANEDFHWCAGEDQISHWSKPGADWESWFCKTCGSALPGANDPERMFVPAGLITSGGEDLKVAHHIYVGSKAEWDEIGGAAVLHPEAFGSGV